MTAKTLHDLKTRDADHAAPAEQFWIPNSEDAEGNGFLLHRELYVTGIDTAHDGSPYPDAFVMLGHQRWTVIIEAAAAYMAHVHDWRTLHLYPGDDPSEVIPRIPRAVHTHGVFLRHQHPDTPCGCEWEGTWRLLWATGSEPGAIPITAMRHPAAPVTASGLPDPDQGTATWATSERTPAR
ncbi:hypothetical protein ACIRPU_42145 [Streptomyces sp. NPDC102259]|uniref:hypothetical protein n=1 Tax=Streptomyces sp. NPDC102259 TaxID=3366148 RepID=UPI0038237F46